MHSSIIANRKRLKCVQFLTRAGCGGREALNTRKPWLISHEWCLVLHFCISLNTCGQQKFSLNIRLPLINLPRSPFTFTLESSIKSALIQSRAISWPLKPSKWFSRKEGVNKMFKFRPHRRGVQTNYFKNKSNNWHNSRFEFLSNPPPPLFLLKSLAGNTSQRMKMRHQSIFPHHRMCNQPFVGSRARNQKGKRASVQIHSGAMEGVSRCRRSPPRLSCCYQKPPAASSARSRRLTHKHRHSPTPCHAC